MKPKFTIADMSRKQMYEFLNICKKQNIRVITKYTTDNVWVFELDNTMTYSNMPEDVRAYCDTNE